MHLTLKIKIKLCLCIRIAKLVSSDLIILALSYKLFQEISRFYL